MPPVPFRKRHASWNLTTAAILLVTTMLTAQLAQARDMYPWTWLKSSCETCGLVIETNRSELETPQVQAFLRELEQQKPRLMSIYKVSGQEYNLLAHMSIGILGRESLFFESRRYYLKEEFPGVISVLKLVKGVIKSYLSGRKYTTTSNSRGPTQIKNIPKKIKDAYGFDEEELGDPQHAAVATMGFLIESLQEMKRRIHGNQIAFVNPSNYVDYLPYMYFGAKNSLLYGIVNPEENHYVLAMKNYMTWVRLYEIDNSVSIGPRP